jgi:hypothetical protein
MKSVDFGTKDKWCFVNAYVHEYLYKDDVVIPLTITPQCYFSVLGSPAGTGPSEISFQACGPAHYFICMFKP